MARLSQNPILISLGVAVGVIFIGFGVNAVVNPASAMSFFELDLPAAAAPRKLFGTSAGLSKRTDARTAAEALLAVYGVRDVFMGLAVIVAAFADGRTTAAGARDPCALGWMVILSGAVAVADGLVCKAYVGEGEWNHWGYAPMVTILGLVLTGLFDRA